jgi:hypothetical protein
MCVIPFTRTEVIMNIRWNRDDDGYILIITIDVDSQRTGDPDEPFLYPWKNHEALDLQLSYSCSVADFSIRM